jgi:hypothetical protein
MRPALEVILAGRARGSGRGVSELAVVLVTAVALGTWATGAGAQRTDVPLPPRLDPPTVPTIPAGLVTADASSEEDLLPPAPTAPGGLVRPPNAARLAPLPEQRGGAASDIEEIVVLGGNWRLPDLGSAWRARQQAAELGDGPHVTFLPLYDPERPTSYNSPFLLNREMTRIGYIDLFRVRFGRRGSDKEEQ